MAPPAGADDRAARLRGGRRRRPVVLSQGAHARMDVAVGEGFARPRSGRSRDVRPRPPVCARFRPRSRSSARARTARSRVVGSGRRLGPVETPAYHRSSCAAARGAFQPLLRLVQSDRERHIDRAVAEYGFRGGAAVSTCHRCSSRRGVSPAPVRTPAYQGAATPLTRGALRAAARMRPRRKRRRRDPRSGRQAWTFVAAWTVVAWSWHLRSESAGRGHGSCRRGPAEALRASASACVSTTPA